MKRITPAVPATPDAIALNPLAGFVCSGVAVVIALLCGAPEDMVKGWGIDLLLALRVDAPAVWILVLDSPDLWHVGVFAALTTALLVTVPGRPRLCLHTAVLLGVFLEFVQIFVPGREAGFGDLLYNLAGVGLGFFVCIFFRKLKYRRAR